MKKLAALLVLCAILVSCAQRGRVDTPAPDVAPEASLTPTPALPEALAAAEELYRKGEGAYSKRSYEEAVRYYKEALGFNPEDERINYKLAMALKILGRYAESNEYFENVLKKNSKNTWAHYGMATNFADMGEKGPALDSLKKAIELDASVAELAKKQEHFKNMRTDPDFILVTTLKEVPIFCYHSVNEGTIGIPELSVKPSEFERQLKYLKDSGYTAITFDELESKSYEKCVILTFDDGYEDNYTVMYPILKKYNMKAVIFLVADKIGTPGYLNEKQIREMLPLVSFQNHTKSHAKLDALDPEAARAEVVEANEAIERITGIRPTVLCYPLGGYNEAVRDIADDYFKYAVDTTRGVYTRLCDPYKIPRLYIKRTRLLEEIIKMMKNK